MKESRASRPKHSRPRRSPGRPPSTRRAKARTKRLIDKLQVLALRRPNAMRLIEIVVDGLLNERRKDDPQWDDGDDGK
jgi:hypothetical protein